DHEENHISFQGKTYSVQELCDLIHLETASSLASYEDDFYAKRPALSLNSFGLGKSYYIAFRNKENFQRDFYQDLMKDLKLQSEPGVSLSPGVSFQVREDEKNRFLFFMNFTKEEKTVLLPQNVLYYDVLHENEVSHELNLSTYDVRVLKLIQQSDNTPSL
ncbi:MAG: beta-galactosidase trimerization domain-containing protein, partial [Vallitaleaceae bacterium]|nr:beta-galactosidase trimerization domain-containing protein [Vallitaleaceae bacterium]